MALKPLLAPGRPIGGPVSPPRPPQPLTGSRPLPCGRSQGAPRLPTVFNTLLTKKIGPGLQIMFKHAQPRGAKCQYLYYHKKKRKSETRVWLRPSLQGKTSDPNSFGPGGTTFASFSVGPSCAGGGSAPPPVFGVAHAPPPGKDGLLRPQADFGRWARWLVRKRNIPCVF